MTLSSSKALSSPAFSKAPSRWEKLLFRARSLRARVLPGWTGFRISRFLYFPLPLTLSDPTVARDIASGQFVLGGRSLLAGNGDPFRLPSPGRSFSAELLGFDWLAHFDAAEDMELREEARRLVAAYFAAGGQALPDAAQPGIAARRVHAFVTHGGLITEGGDLDHYQAIFHSLRADAALLAPVARFSGAGIQQAFAATALLSLALATDSTAKQLERIERLAGQAIAGCISEDGVPVSFSADHALRIATELVPLLSLYRARTRKLPGWLEPAILRLARFLRLMRHPDGDLARFSRSSHASRDLTGDILDFAGTRLLRLNHAQPSGFERLETEYGVVIADSGALPPKPARTEIGVSALSFEYSDRSARIIVNCGVPRSAEGEIESAYRSGPAHSGIAIAGQDLGRIEERRLRTGEASLVLAGPALALPATRLQGDAGETLVLGHTGFQERTGLIVERHLTLLASRSGLRGLDRFIDVKRLAEPQQVTLTFHLDPDVHPEELDRPDAVALSLPQRAGIAGAAAPDLWLFQAPGQRISISESRFFSAGSGKSVTKRLLIETEITGNAEINWQIVPFDG